MTDEEHGAAAACDVFHLAEALLLERGVPNRENFIDKENLRLKVGSHRKSETHEHAARVMLDLHVEKFLHFGECHDLVEFAIDLGFLHTEQRAV